MERDPERRYPSMAAFAEDLDASPAATRSPRGRPGSATCLGLFVRRHRGPVRTAAAALVVIVVGTICF